MGHYVLPSQLTIIKNYYQTIITNPNHDQRHKYHHLMKTLHSTLQMTTAQVVEMSVTNNSLSKDYPHPELDSEDDYRSGSRNISHQQQSF